jgi:hypothetical protein
MLDFTCQSCGTHHEVDDDYAAQTLECCRCGQQVRLTVVPSPPSNSNDPPVDRCFCCCRPVWDGDFVRREIRVGSSTGSTETSSLGNSWGGYHGGRFLSSRGVSEIHLNHTAFRTVCNDCASKLDEMERRWKKRRKNRAMIMGILIIIGACLFLAFAFLLITKKWPH